MTLNHFDLIQEQFLQRFNNNHDIYFHLQILQRKKEHPEIGSNSRVIKQYLIVPDSSEQRDLMHYKDEIVYLCDKLQARAYINLNPKSLSTLAKMSIMRLAERNLNGDLLGMQDVVFSCAGEQKAISKDEVVWVVDVDGNLDSAVEVGGGLNDIGATIICPFIKTINGYHILTRKFDRCEFAKYYPEVDIQTNNPTLLYYNDTND